MLDIGVALYGPLGLQFPKSHVLFYIVIFPEQWKDHGIQRFHDPSESVSLCISLCLMANPMTQSWRCIISNPGIMTRWFVVLSTRTVWHLLVRDLLVTICLHTVTAIRLTIVTQQVLEL